MRDPGLDFQPRRPGLLALALFAAGLLLAADAWHEAAALREQLTDAELRLAQVERRAERGEQKRRDNRPENLFSGEDSKSIQNAVAAIRRDWEGLYRAIDQAAGKDVALLAVRPDSAGKAVQISGEARNLAAALAFVDALRQGPLGQAVLQSHQIKQNDPERPVVFEIAATWPGA